MVHKHLTTLAGATIAALTLFWLAADFRSSGVTALMEERLGARNFRVIQQNNTVGFLHTSAGKDANNNWFMTQQLNINMLNAAPYTSEQTQTFASKPPYNLLSAVLKERRQGQQQQIEVRQSSEGYEIAIRRNGDTETLTKKWQFSLNDQLALEQQLNRDADVGDLVTERFLDLASLRLNQREHRLIGITQNRYILEAIESKAKTELDLRLRPMRFDAPHQFRFELTTQDIEPRQTFLNAATVQWASQNAVAPVTAPLERPRHLTSLTLQLRSLGQRTLAEQGLPRALSATSYSNIDLKKANISTDKYLQGSLTLPVDHSKVVALLGGVTPSYSSAEELAGQLIKLTREQLLYAEHQPARSVLASLESGRGECVDFADLLTTLARTQDIPARTVYGIAYSATPTPGFRFHAWNEIHYGQRWHVLDPTWNQSVADATHIELDDQTLAAVASAMQRQSIVLATEQFSYGKKL